MMRISIICFTLCLCVNLVYGASVTVTGTINYDKRVYTHPSTNLAETVTATALAGAKVEVSDLFNGILGTGFTNTNGVYSITVDFNSANSNSFTIKVNSSNSSVEVGTNVLNGSITGIYSNTVASNQTSAGTYNLEISETNNSGAYNIYMQLDKGRQWFEGKGKSFTKTINAVWPTSSGTFFDVGQNTVYLLGVTGGNFDPDEFDDDVILHEFGHLAMEAFSIDHSAGGSHSLTATTDLRLAWSEGVATWISCAIRGDAVYKDSTGSKDSSNKTINNPYDHTAPRDASKESGNEAAITYVLWNAASGASDQSIIDVVSSFKSLPSSLEGEQISMDTFNDLWTTTDLSSFYTNRSMSYNTDSLNVFNISSPRSVSASETFSDLTFFPGGNSDYFTFSAQAGGTYTFETSKARNGALTKIDLYKDSISTDSLVQSNSQKNGSVSDTTSKLSFKSENNSTYFLEVSRFNSSTRNYGVAPSTYTKTVGRYGTYDLSSTLVAPTAISLLSSSDDDTTVTNALTSTYSSSTGTALTSAISNLTVVSAGQSKEFSTSELYVSTIGTTSISSVTHVDPSFGTVISNIPSDRTFVYATMPLSVDSNAPVGSTGKLMVFSLKNGSEEVSSGFSIGLKLTGAASSSSNQRLYVQNSTTGAFSDSGFTPSISGSDLEFTMTHFSNYVLVNETLASSSTTSTNSTASASAPSSSGGGGGCFLK